MRLDNYLLRNKIISSKKDLKKLLKGNYVRINDTLIYDENFDVEGRIHQLTIEGEIIPLPSHQYLMINKPQGYLTAKKDAFEQTIFELLREEDRTPDLFPIGRLDRDTEGLLLLTDNGALGYKLFMPNYYHEKKYYAVINGEITENDVGEFKKGIVFHDGTNCRPALLDILSSKHNESEVIITLTEGKYHQIKKMVLSVGKEVKYLKRIEMAGIKLDNQLKIGDYRHLTESEINTIFKT